MQILAVITARGKSKRIPRKNIKWFCGKPIISYSIEASIESGIFDEVMVSTEDEEIARIAGEYGAAVPFLRSEETSDDFATTSDVLVEVVQQYQSMGKSFDWICCIYPTAPFVNASKLVESWRLLEKSGAHALMPVVKYSYPPQRSLYIDERRELRYQWPENDRKRSQDLPPIYHDVGQFYFLKTAEFMKTRSLLLDRTIPYLVSELEMQDIDNLVDWKLAEIKFHLMEQTEPKKENRE